MLRVPLFFIAVVIGAAFSPASAQFAAQSSATGRLSAAPGPSGGSSAFDISVSAPPPCGTYDDGSSDNALGLAAGGEVGWMHYQDCLADIQSVETAYFTPGGGPPHLPARSVIAIYEDADCDGDPTTGPPVLLFSVVTVSMNHGANILNSTPTGIVAIGSGCSWVMATFPQRAGALPVPMDTTNPTPNAWITGQTPTGANLDISDINNNNVPPLQAQANGFPTAWLLRAIGNEIPGQQYPQSCFGAAGCPCANDGDGLGGCENSVTRGATLSGSGAAVIGSDTFVLSVSRSTGQPGVFFQGNDSLANPLTFGDGFRCCGNGALRIGTYAGGGGTVDTTTGTLIGGIGPPISQHPGNAGLVPGDTRCYQWWYRDPAGPCGSLFNLSNSVSATWL